MILLSNNSVLIQLLYHSEQTNLSLRVYPKPTEVSTQASEKVNETIKFLYKNEALFKYRPQDKKVKWSSRNDDWTKQKEDQTLKSENFYYNPDHFFINIKKMTIMK